MLQRTDAINTESPAQRFGTGDVQELDMSEPRDRENCQGFNITAEQKWLKFLNC